MKGDEKKMLENIIKKDIASITLQDLENLYNTYNVATVKIADNQLAFIQE